MADHGFAELVACMFGAAAVALALGMTGLYWWERRK